MKPSHLISMLSCLFLLAAAPQPGDVQKMVTVNAWISDTGQASMHATTGTVFDGGGHYQTVKLRYWYFVDGGLDVPPVLPGPADFVILSQASPTLCSSSFVCSRYDGGLDPALAAPSGCFCAIDATCTAHPPDGGGAVAALKGITLPGAGWTSPSGAGCAPKACMDLWTNLSDGGADSSWPAACPLQ